MNKNLNKVKLMFRCPMCNTINKVDLGGVDCGGTITYPDAHCDCGFSYSPRHKVNTPAGSSGWDWCYAQVDNSLKRIKEMLNCYEE